MSFDMRQQNCANNFKALACYAPPDTQMSLVFGFDMNYSINDFLEKLNIPHLFSSISEWHTIKITCDVIMYYMDVQLLIVFVNLMLILRAVVFTTLQIEFVPLF